MTNQQTQQVVLYQSKNRNIELDVLVDDDTVWLTQDQMTKLFGRDRSVITKHIQNVFKEGELSEKSNVQNLHIANSDKPVKTYNLDVVISVGSSHKKGLDFVNGLPESLKSIFLKVIPLIKVVLQPTILNHSLVQNYILALRKKQRIFFIL